MRSAFRSSVVVIVTLALLAPAVSAEDRAAEHDRKDPGPWRGLVDMSLGFVRRYEQPGVCPSTGSKVASALSSLSPNAIGAIMGFTIGAAAGAMTTRSVVGAVRAAFVAGSIGSAIGLIAAHTPASDQLKAMGDRLKRLAEQRDREVCGVVDLGERLRTPVLRHMGSAMQAECDVTAEGVESLDHETGSTLQRCVRTNPDASRILEKHVPMLRTINQTMCRSAASIVEDYNRLIAEAKPEHRHASAPRPMPTDCDDSTDRAPSRGWAPQLRSVHYF